MSTLNLPTALELKATKRKRKRAAGFPPRVFFVLICFIGGIGLFAPASASAAPPQVHDTWVEGVGATSAVFHARLDGEGLPTTFYFEHVDKARFEVDGFALALKTPEKDAGKGSDLPASAAATGLSQETTYHYRIVARNADGTTLGPERVLTTKRPGGPLVLLDNRGWEMVSPVDKNGGEIAGPGATSGGGVFQAAVQGGAVTFSSVSSFGVEAEGAPVASQYVSRRGGGGWAAENVTAPLLAGSYGEEPDGVPYQLFSTGLSRGLLSAPGYPPLPGTGAPAGYRNYYVREPTGAYTALLTYADIAGLTVPAQSFELNFSGASPDLEHVVLSTCAALTADATEVAGPGEGCDPGEPNLYERSASGLRLLNVLPGDSIGTSPAHLAAPSGAISSDGSRVYWTDGTDLYLNEAGVGTVQVDEDVGGSGTFQVASSDGSVALFTKAGSLYRYDVAGGATTNLTPGGGVIGVLGASADASGVYFQTAAGLVLHRSGSSTVVIEHPAAADASNFPPSTGTARVSADGSRLAFVSSAELTPYDNTETATGEPATEVHHYNADAKKLTCVSCNPTGERPSGPSSIPGAVANGKGAGATRAYKPRALAANGNRLFFDSDDALVPGDSNNAPDVYEWEAQGSGNCTRAGGCLQLISAGSTGASSFVDASAGGEDVFFLTANSLVKSDPGSVDLYDAREGGGFPEPPPPFVCEEDACQPLPSPPDDPAPGTLVPSAPNPPVHFPKTNKAKKNKAKARKGKAKAKKNGKKKGTRQGRHRRGPRR